jgi:hypothetical protein
MTDKDVVICGHGSGTPSTKNLNTYSSSRYKSIAKNGKHKGIVAVKRHKKMTDDIRKKFHDAYKTILGRNAYSQSLRQYVFTAHNGKYYSDCSSSGCAAYKKAGISIGLLNTAGVYNSSDFETVKVTIKEGHITNPEVLKVGDAILFAGDDASRPLQIGHVEYVYEINGKSSSTTAKKASAKVTSVSSTSTVYYKKYTGASTSLVDALVSIGVTDTSLTNRKAIAKVNGISAYSGSAEQNTKLLELLKNGKLKK